MSAVLIKYSILAISQVTSYTENFAFFKIFALEYLITFADYFLLAIILIGTKLKNKLISLLAILQFVFMFIFEFKVQEIRS